MFKDQKSKIQKEEKSDVLYKIDNPDSQATYIGETIQKLGSRIYQHQYDCKSNKPPDRLSPLAIHSIDNGHTFKFKDAEILTTKKNTNRKLQIYEVNQIIKFEQSICNNKSDVKDQSSSYNLIKMGFE